MYVHDSSCGRCARPSIGSPVHGFDRRRAPTDQPAAQLPVGSESSQREQPGEPSRVQLGLWARLDSVWVVEAWRALVACGRRSETVTEAAGSREACGMEGGEEELEVEVELVVYNSWDKPVAREASRLLLDYITCDETPWAASWA
jgi:hypothetical protein